VIFQDFPGPGIFKKKNPGLSRRRGNTVETIPANTYHSLVAEMDTEDWDQAAMADSLASPYLKQNQTSAN